MINYSDLVRRIRESKGLTQKELGSMTGKTQGYIQGLENGRLKEPGIGFIAELAIRLQVNPYAFIREGEPLFVPPVPPGRDAVRKKLEKYEQLVKKMHEVMVG